MSADRLLRLPDAETKVGLSRTAIYERITPKSKRFDPTFPRPVPIGARAIAFSEHELDAWIALRKAARDAVIAAPPKRQRRPVIEA